MALVALVCPQCGANLNMDDSRDFGFCQYCGTKVMLHETIEIKHSGSIKIDNSEQERNYLQLANSCFKSGNFSQAYSYYLKTLEINPRNVVGVYMKGICAAYNSDPHNINVNEYVYSVNQARTIALDNEGNPSDQVLKNIETQSLALAQYWLDKSIPVQPVSKEQGECVSEFSKAVNAANLVLNIVKTIYSETGKENLIEQNLGFINTVSKTKLQYFAGTQTDKKGRTVPIYKSITLSNDQQANMRNISVELKDIFNNLPSRIAMSSDINERLNIADEEVNQLKAQLKEKKSQRNSLLFASIKDRKNTDLKAQIASLDTEIKALESQLGDAKSVSKTINGEMKDFKRTIK